MQPGNTQLEMSHSPLSMRCDIVKDIVERELATLPELERRRLETTVLQILAPIYAPPRSKTPVAAEQIFRMALDAKRVIDEREAARVAENKPQFVRPIPRRVAAQLHPVLMFPSGSRS